MFIVSKAHLLIILMPAMAKALRIPVPQYLSLAYMTMLDQVRHEAPLKVMVDRLWENDDHLTRQQVVLLVRMTRTLWSIIKHIPKLEETNA